LFPGRSATFSVKSGYPFIALQQQHRVRFEMSRTILTITYQCASRTRIAASNSGFEA
jgi:hypothetical protein